ncbi:OPT oligopeptide transporter [Suillus spraguei]|nr:OPT oligopeptide transporter [Suillus spraguei]
MQTDPQAAAQTVPAQLIGWPEIGNPQNPQRKIYLLYPGPLLFKTHANLLPNQFKRITSLNFNLGLKVSLLISLSTAVSIPAVVMANFKDERGSSTDFEKSDVQVQKALEAIANFDDPNIDRDSAIIGVLEDDSPYPEVRSAVANTDDPSIPCNSFRAWVIGILWTIFIAGLNQFFFFRYPTVSITGIAAQLLCFPMGRAWAKLIGFSIGGILRRFLVQPPSMSTNLASFPSSIYNSHLGTVWPANLVTCALFNTLHSKTYAGMGTRGGISRERFFFYAWMCGLLWYLVPGYLFQALSVFSWVCWIAPDNIVVNQMFGYVSGMGMSMVTFDWAQIAYIGSPLATPWWAEANVAAGFIVFFWLAVPTLYYTNTWYSQYMPTPYDNTGATYDITRITNSDASLNLTAYQEYSPLFISTTFTISYGLSFASITATLMHTFLFFRKQIWSQSKRSMHEQPDIHARLMSKYRQVPEWWYMIVFLSMFVIGVISIELWHTEFPVWAFVLALSISFFYVVPIGMIQAITNQPVGLNVITELIVGYAIPGRPIAMMMPSHFGNSPGSLTEKSAALTFASDFKLGHYMKIPPRTMFWGQVVATAVAGTVQLGVQAWMFTNIPDMCSTSQKDGFICPGTEVFGTASFIWGVIGPQRQFSSGQVYNGVHFLSTLYLYGPKGFCTKGFYISSSLLHSLCQLSRCLQRHRGHPPASALNYVPWAIVGFIFQYIIRRRYFSWWAKYNYVLSAAMDSGVAISSILIFFCLQYPKNGTIGLNTIQKWWGNTVFSVTADGKSTPLLKLQEGSTFGPTTW